MTTPVVRHDDAVSFLEDLSPHSRPAASRFIYRGQANADWDLLPTALRTGDSGDGMWLLDLAGLQAGDDYPPRLLQAQAEFRVLALFYAEADRAGLAVPQNPEVLRIQATRIGSDFGMDLDSWVRFEAKPWLPHSVRELAALAQHYGVPTKMLDWSYDHLTAAYFAAHGALSNSTGDEDADLCVWELRIGVHGAGRWAGPAQPELVRPPYAGNPNLRAQRGVFTHVSSEADWRGDDRPPVDRTPLDRVVANGTELPQDDGRLRQVILNRGAAGDLFDRLDQVDVNAAAIYPGYRGAARGMEERHAWAGGRLRTVYDTPGLGGLRQEIWTRSLDS